MIKEILSYRRGRTRNKQQFSPLVPHLDEDILERFYRVPVFAQLRSEGLHYPDFAECDDLWRRTGEEYFRIPGVVKIGEYPYRSGGSKPFYMDFDVLVAHPERCRAVAYLYLKHIADRMVNPEERAVDFLCFPNKVATPVGAISISGFLSMMTNLPLVIVNMKSESNLTRVKPESLLIQPAAPGKELVKKVGLFVTDHCTTGKESSLAIQALRSAGAEITDMFAFTAWSDRFRQEEFEKENLVVCHIMHRLVDVSDKDGNKKVIVLVPPDPVPDRLEFDDFPVALETQRTS